MTMDMKTQNAFHRCV